MTRIMVGSFLGRAFLRLLDLLLEPLEAPPRARLPQLARKRLDSRQRVVESILAAEDGGGLVDLVKVGLGRRLIGVVVFLPKLDHLRRLPRTERKLLGLAELLLELRVPREGLVGRHRPPQVVENRLQGARGLRRLLVPLSLLPNLLELRLERRPAAVRTRPLGGGKKVLGAGSRHAGEVQDLCEGLLGL